MMRAIKLLFLLLLSRVGYSAVAFDAAASTQGIATSYTWAHTCTGSNLVLVVGIATKSGTLDTVTGVTYNSVSLTRAGVTQTAQGATYLYYILSPSTGANNVVVSTGVEADNTVVGSASYTGVTAVGAFVAVTAASTSISTNYTTSVDNAWLASMISNRNTSITWTNDSGGTTRWGPLSQGSGANSMSGIQADQVAAVTAGANTVSFTASSSGTSSLAVLELQPSGAAPTPTPVPSTLPIGSLGLMGVGL